MHGEKPIDGEKYNKYVEKKKNILYTYRRGKPQNRHTLLYTYAVLYRIPGWWESGYNIPSSSSSCTAADKSQHSSFVLCSVYFSSCAPAENNNKNNAKKIVGHLRTHVYTLYITSSPSLVVATSRAKKSFKTSTLRNDILFLVFNCDRATNGGGGGCGEENAVIIIYILLLL